MTVAYGSLLFFSYFFSQNFVDSSVFWCHPTTCKDKGIEWRLLYVNHSLVVLILLFFMLLVDLCKGLPQNELWHRVCDPYVKEQFLRAIPQSSCKDIQPCIVSSVDFLSKSFSLIGKSVGSVWTSLQTSLIICASEYLTELKYKHPVYIWGCDPQSMSHHKHSGWVCLSPSMSHADGIC